jgi:Fe-S cluster assembly protein SufD
MNLVPSSDFNTSFVKRFQEWEQQLNGQRQTAWHQIRKKAIELVADYTIPTTKNEEWKYTNLNKIFKQDFVFEVENQSIDKNTLTKTPLFELDTYKIVLLNGEARLDLSDLPQNPKIFISTLTEAYKIYPNWVEKYFAQVPDWEKELFTALNTAFAQKGLFILAEKNANLDKPILLQHITDATIQNVGSQPRHLLIFETGSNISLIENYVTLGENYSFVNGVSEIFVMPNAHIQHYKVQHETEKAFQILTTQVKQEKDSFYENITLSLKGGLMRNNLNIRLTGTNVASNMFGLYMIDGKSHVDNHTIADHLAPHSLSNELYKGILDENATGVFNGKIYVRQDAQKTNAYQQNRNVLLSDTASVNTKPQLEIWADDVKCSHGATTGKLDENALFYLRARGIKEKSAKALLVQAFGNEIIEKINFEPLKEYFTTLLAERLGVE